MTIGDAIAKVNELLNNVYSDDAKIMWLSTVDGYVNNEVIQTHEHAEPIINSYTPTTPTDTKLLIDEPYTDAYIHYLMAMIHLNNGELIKYNNEITLYSAIYNDYKRWYNRTHKPIETKVTFF